MNRYIIIFVTILLIAIAAAGAAFFLRPNSNPAPVIQQGTYQPTSSTVSVTADRSKEAARAAFQNALDKNNIDNTKLQETVVVGDWALQAWGGDVMGGEALMKYDESQGRWAIVISSGGVWSVDALVGAGVPKDIAATLVAGMPR